MGIFIGNLSYFQKEIFDSKECCTVEIPYNEISCNEAYLLRARHASL